MGHPQRSAAHVAKVVIAICVVRRMLFAASTVMLGSGAHVIGAVAMMHVEVEHHNPLQIVPLLGILRSNGDRVEQAEPHRTLVQADHWQSKPTRPMPEHAAEAVLITIFRRMADIFEAKHRNAVEH